MLRSLAMSIIPLLVLTACAPKLDGALQPDEGSVLLPTTATLRGKRLGKDPPTVTVGDALATVIAHTPTSIELSLPALPAGSYPVAVEARARALEGAGTVTVRSVFGDLGSLDELRSDVLVRGMSGSGDAIVGQARQALSMVPLLWTTEGLQVLPALSGGSPDGVALAVDDGRVVGQAHGAGVDGSIGFHAVVWVEEDEGWVATALEAPEGASACQATVLRGEQVAGWCLMGGDQAVAVSWEPAPQILTAGATMEVTGIDAQGQIYGTSGSGAGAVAWRWDGAVVTPLGSQPAQAWAASEDGAVVVGAVWVDDAWRPGRWTALLGWKALSDSEGRVRAVDASGQLMGGQIVEAGVPRAWLWRGDGAEAEVAASDDGWTLFEVMAVSAQGQVLAGRAALDARRRGWRWEIGS